MILILNLFLNHFLEEEILSNEGVRKEFDYDQMFSLTLNIKMVASVRFLTINGFDMRATYWIIGAKATMLGRSIYSEEGNWAERFFKPQQKDIMSDRDPKIVQKRKFGEEMYEMVSIQEHVKNFVDSIIKGEEPLVSGVDGRKSVEIGIAAEKSVIVGEPVKLPL